MMASSSDQSNELSVLDGGDGNVFPDSVKIFGVVDCTIRLL